MSDLLRFSTSVASIDETGDNFAIERQLYSLGRIHVAGTDEVGRGPLAGPVIAAAVILPEKCNPSSFLDSKKISHKKRLTLHQSLEELGAYIAIGSASSQEIDKINILQASLLAMKRAVLNLTLAPDFLLVDGKFKVPIDLAQLPLIKGENKSASIAAASIVAKLARDQLMEELGKKYPHYNFGKHKGYPTKEHRKAIIRHGPCPAHRFTFRGVKEYA